MGGEKAMFSVPSLIQSGSPPRGRGKGYGYRLTQGSNRITPAWAGKRRTHITPITNPWDHPRVGGEKQKMPVRTDKRMGSPPRGRGKDIVVKGHSSKEGITPAWAGKSKFYRCVSCQCEDHPRVGGEKVGLCRCHHGVIGSPPRGRGKGWLVPLPSWRDRITPAWAGKSMEQGGIIRYTKDHPRVGGEKGAKTKKEKTN